METKNIPASSVLTYPFCSAIAPAMGEKLPHAKFKRPNVKPIDVADHIVEDKISG